MVRVKHYIGILIRENPHYFDRPLDMRLDHVRDLLTREEVIRVSRTEKDLTESAAADRELYQKTTGQKPAKERYTAKKTGRLSPYSRKQRQGNKVRTWDES